MAENTEKVQDLEGEVWKDVQGYEGMYQVSNMGRVKRLQHVSRNKTVKFKKVFQEKLIKVGKNGNYYRLGLRKDNFTKFFKIHRLVAIHFVANPENKCCVNHIDYDPSNNLVSNLEWVSYLENSSHAVANKNYSSKFLGITWDKNAKKWRSRINIDGTFINLGLHTSELDAYEARRKFEQDNGIQNKYL